MNIGRIFNDDVDMVETLVLTCSGCRNPFEHSPGEQRFYASKGWDSKPHHCPTCRAARRAERDAGRKDDEQRQRRLMK